jgi:hypothetical protein
VLFPKTNYSNDRILVGTIGPTVTFNKTSDGRLAAVVSNNTENQHTVFVLETNQSSAVESAFSLTDVVISYQQTSVEFYSRTTQSSVVFQLSDIPDITTVTSIRIIYKGTGLIKNNNETLWGLLDGATGSTWPPIEAYTCKCRANGTAASCDTGSGPGNSSCSSPATSTTGSCSVSCGSGYYACCTDQ